MSKASILGLIVGVLIYWGFWWQIFDKAKYKAPAFMGVLMCLPIVNFVMFIFFAFSTWPIEKELKQIKKVD